MKLGVSYNTFDGLENLKCSIEQIRDEVFHINIIYQLISNHGSLAEPYLEEYLNYLIKEGLINSITEYKPQNSLNPNHSCHLNEFKKRVQGYEVLKQAGCSHFQSMDNDEFYDKELYKKAIKKIDKKGYDSTCCTLIDYYGQPTYCKGRAGYFVPFIHNIKTIPNLNPNFYKYTDPTRKIINYINPYTFKFEDEVVMHHMTSVRIDEQSLRNKLNNSSSKINFQSIDNMIKEVLLYKPEMEAHATHEPDRFGIIKGYEDFQKWINERK